MLSALLLTAPSAHAVVGGQPGGNQHPNIGLIWMLDYSGMRVSSCTGTLVTPTRLLSDCGPALPSLMGGRQGGTGPAPAEPAGDDARPSGKFPASPAG